MQRILVMLATLCSCWLGACSPSSLEQAEAGLRNIVARIQVPAPFARIVSWSESFTGVDGKCHYAREHWLLGSDLSSTQALEDFTNALKSAGWVLWLDPQTELTMSTERTLVWGDRAYIVVTTAISPYTKSHLKGIEMDSTLTTLLYVAVTYVIPMREGC